MRRPKGATGGHSMQIVRLPKPKPKKKKQVKEVKYIKYGCPKGHYRTERTKLEGDLPFCTTCHMTTGEYVRIKYISTKRG